MKGMRRDQPPIGDVGAFLAVNALTAYEGGVRRRLGLDLATGFSAAPRAVQAVDADGVVVIAGGGTIQSWEPS